jgi:DNA-binding response OmpR family regulator
VVFIIDADDDARVTHETILRAEGFELMSAPDGARGLALLRDQMPDLVLLANKIGTLNVTKLIEVIRADPAMRKLPVAAYGGRRNGDALMNAGANVYIVTPCAPQEFVRRIVGLIGRA